MIKPFNYCDIRKLKFIIHMYKQTLHDRWHKLLKYVTGPDKTGLIALFCISRNTIFDIECTVLLWWLDTVTPDILYNKCSYIAIIS